jgi:hypothetical protein
MKKMKMHLLHGLNFLMVILLFHTALYFVHLGVHLVRLCGLPFLLPQSSSKDDSQNTALISPQITQIDTD